MPVPGAEGPATGYDMLGPALDSMLAIVPVPGAEGPATGYDTLGLVSAT